MSAPEQIPSAIVCPEHGDRCGGDDCCCVDKHASVSSNNWPENWFHQVPMFPQRQDSTMTQVLDLHRIANRLGLYDAADWLMVRVEQTVADSGS